MSVGINRRDDLNKTPVAAHARLGDAIGCVVALYDFLKHGGAIGTVNLGVKLPKNAVIMKTMLDVLIQPTSAGSATVALGVSGGGGATTTLLGATAKASLTTGRITGVQDWVAANTVKLTAEGDVTATIATAALTAGKIAVMIWFAETTDSTAFNPVE